LDILNLLSTLHDKIWWYKVAIIVASI
jgi:hypothetical protein